MHVPQRCDHVLDEQRVVVFHVDLDMIAQVGTACEQEQVLELILSGDDEVLGVILAVDSHAPALVLGELGTPQCRLALPGDLEDVPDQHDIDILGLDTVHVLADLLEVARVHGHDGLEARLGDIHHIGVHVDDLEAVLEDLSLVLVHDLDAEAVLLEIVGGAVEGQDVVVIDGLDHLVQGLHVNADGLAVHAGELVKVGAMQPHVHEHPRLVVDREDLHAPSLVRPFPFSIGDELDVAVDEDIFECFDESLEGRGLDGSDLDESFGFGGGGCRDGLHIGHSRRGQLGTISLFLGI